MEWSGGKVVKQSSKVTKEGGKQPGNVLSQNTSDISPSLHFRKIERGKCQQCDSFVFVVSSFPHHKHHCYHSWHHRQSLQRCQRLHCCGDKITSSSPPQVKSEACWHICVGKFVLALPIPSRDFPCCSVSDLVTHSNC